MKHAVAALSIVVLGASAVGHASDRIGIYAVIDKVVFEPNADNPERIQIWGAFAVATPNDRDNYEAVKRGYLYFQAGRPYNGTTISPEMSRAEWNDLKSVAGSGRIVGFGSRFVQSVRVRAQDERPQSPDAYVTGIGVNVVRPNTDYAPIKALAAHITR